MTTTPDLQPLGIDRSNAFWGQHQMSRARRRHVSLLAAEGFVHRRFVPYEFRDNNAGFHVFDRIA